MHDIFHVFLTLYIQNNSSKKILLLVAFIVIISLFIWKPGRQRGLPTSDCLPQSPLKLLPNWSNVGSDNSSGICLLRRHQRPHLFLIAGSLATEQSQDVKPRSITWDVSILSRHLCQAPMPYLFLFSRPIDLKGRVCMCVFAKFILMIFVLYFYNLIYSNYFNICHFHFCTWQYSGMII